MVTNEGVEKHEFVTVGGAFGNTCIKCACLRNSSNHFPYEGGELGESTLQSLARNIINQLLDEAEVSVEKRQSINDRCDQFVQSLIDVELAETRGRAGRILAQEERAHGQTVQERDTAEEAFTDLCAKLDVETEFSNLRGYDEILADAYEAVDALNKAAETLASERDALTAALEDQPCRCVYGAPDLKKIPAANLIRKCSRCAALRLDHDASKEQA